MGKDAEIACRGNLSLCMLQKEDYEEVVEQCERILHLDENNAKANFRMSQAAFALSHGRSLWQLKTALKYARLAKSASND